MSNAQLGWCVNLVIFKCLFYQFYLFLNTYFYPFYFLSILSNFSMLTVHHHRDLYSLYQFSIFGIFLLTLNNVIFCFPIFVSTCISKWKYSRSPFLVNSCLRTFNIQYDLHLICCAVYEFHSVNHFFSKSYVSPEKNSVLSVYEYVYNIYSFNAPVQIVQRLSICKHAL